MAVPERKIRKEETSTIENTYPQCARCPYTPQDRLCHNENGKAPPFCPTANLTAIIQEAVKEFEKPEILNFAKQASLQEAAGYADRELGYARTKPLKPRLMETAEFAERMGYKKLGLVFCLGLAAEARMGPPPEIRQGCDLVIEFPLIEELRILKILTAAGLAPLKTVPVTSPLLQPVDIFQIRDYGKYLMVRAANMKLTVDRETNIIVNISGGGCPDVPYLAAAMVGQPLAGAPSPREIGHTLCGYALQLAYEEVRRRCSV